MNKEQFQKEVTELEINLKTVKKNYKKFIKLNKGNLNEESILKIKEVKEYIKTGEKNLRLAKMQLYMFSSEI